MNILLWVLQVFAALVYGASGVMKGYSASSWRSSPTAGAVLRPIS